MKRAKTFQEAQQDFHDAAMDVREELEKLAIFRLLFAAWDYYLSLFRWPWRAK